MFFKSFIGAMCICLAIISFNANAALVDNGTYTTDDVSGLDWLDLEFTSSSYSDALTGNAGWRYATNAEVENLFSIAFDGYYDTNTTNHTSSNYQSYYNDQITDILIFQDLFGLSGASPSVLKHEYSYGMYVDEDGILRIMGARITEDESLHLVVSTEYTEIYDPNTVDIYNTFLVRDVSVVPIPASLWLFGSGLISLISIARRKKL